MSDHHFAGECADGTRTMMQLTTKPGNDVGEAKLAGTLFLPIPCGYCGIKHLTRVTAQEFVLLEEED